MRARALAQRLGPRLGTTIIIENKPGAGGVIGAEQVARALPDGSTLLFTSSAITTNAAVQPKLPYDPIKGFAPVAMVARSSLILVVSNATPYKSVPQLLQAMRERNNQITYGSSGIGSVNHVSTELLHSMAGTSALHLAYKGISNVMVDMLGGRVHVLLTSVASAGAQVKAGQIRALAVSSPKPSRFNPELPTLGEFVPGYSSEVWWGVFAPGKTPKSLVDRFNAEIVAITAEPEMQKLFAQEAAEASNLSAVEFSAIVVDEIGKWQKVARERNITAE